MNIRWARVGDSYITDSEDSRDVFLDTERRATIAEAYAVTGSPDISLYELQILLREAAEYPSPA